MEWFRLTERSPLHDAQMHWAQYKEALEVIVCNDQTMMLPRACTYDPIDKCFVGYEGEEIKPTHWMLLPKMPGPSIRFLCLATRKECCRCTPGPCNSRRRV